MNKIIRKHIAGFGKIKNSLLIFWAVVVFAVTGCDSADHGTDLDGQTYQSTTGVDIATQQASGQDSAVQETQELPENKAEADSNVGQIQDDQPLSSDDLLIDVSALSIPDYSGTDFYIVNDNVPFFDDRLRNYTGDNFIYLSELDGLGRCGTCIGLFSNSTLPTEARGEIGHIKPSGWHTAKYDKSVISEMYLYNRCHLLMYAVSGLNDDTRNLITGTRQFNLDMLELENQVLDTLKYDESARLLYRVTPLFEGDNLVAKGVLMEAMCLGDEDGLSFCMFIYNVQDGIVIDYATGESALADEGANVTTSTETATEVSDKASNADTTKESGQQVGDNDTQSTTDYVVNTSSKKFHYTWCSSVEKIKSENRLDYSGTRDELIDMGYEPCGKCEP